MHLYPRTLRQGCKGNLASLPPSGKQGAHPSRPSIWQEGVQSRYWVEEEEEGEAGPETAYSVPGVFWTGLHGNLSTACPCSLPSTPVKLFPKLGIF